MSDAGVLACVEVGGSGHQTVLFDDTGWRIVDGARCPSDADLAMAVPGIIDGRRVVAASNLDWYDVDPAAQLGLPTPALVVMNDAEAAALGESVRRAAVGEPLPDLVFVGLGTGVGGAVVADGQVTASNLFGHARPYSDLACRCGQRGCLETVVSGWALPGHLTAARIDAAAAALATAIEREPNAAPRTVVVAGGMARSNRGIVDALQQHLPARAVERSAAPPGAKSASGWGLRHAVHRLPIILP